MGDIPLPVIGAVRAWQLVFLVMAIPDLILGLLMLTTVYEPPRRPRRWPRAQVIAPHQSAPCSRICGASGRPSDPCSWDSRATRSPWGTQVWAAAFYQRTYGWGPAQYGIIQGLVCC